MTRRIVIVLAAAAGLLLGSLTMVAIQGTPRSIRPETVVLAPRPVALPETDDRVLLVWSPGRLPSGFGATVKTIDGVERVTTVRSGTSGLAASHAADGGVVDEADAGFTIPLDTMAFDNSYLSFVPRDARAQLARLIPGQALLSETSARLRRLEPGATLQLTPNRRLTVTGVVDDTVVGAAELAVTATDAASLGIVDERYLLIAYRGARVAIEQQIRQAAPADASLRVRGPGETPFLRHGDAVLPQAYVKERFGEFAYHLEPGGKLTPNPEWVSDNIVTTTVPLLGRVTCHRGVVEPLRGALRELAERNLDFLVDRSGFGGCWNPRLVAGSDGLSRHAWGIAVDLNTGKNPTGLASAQDGRLVSVMERWGFTWGGRWLIPDPAHFEYLRPPRT